MNVNISYSNFLTENGEQILNSISATLSPQTEMLFSIKKQNDNQSESICNIKLADKIGVNEISDNIQKQDVRELIEMLKVIYKNM
ncbi:asparagine synthetase B (glutamine-hydrolysing) [Clostridium acetobutylicum]|uniref:Uncharacterized protein n=1 Tax=Clostridium acetobutylicum (strain ATCC 824 / DSM 792 / JCM 1419 / IAM 19013 / LMG 5710 / NBRC 13948 / NRRL B-527 / VKM B-1787 / 2291 / W) TaxID=272562 RepID=Q97K16_CLOAB|nr:hypothetical protein [Clostridium acetobutylicum]PSM04952.1 hypothetical protein C7T89_16525 [Clostridium sp. NJ4]AAK79079.1 Hypothetical protein CA_C1105 [Clostridium acetobutylicum ATCC 824]ADZ20154.1 Conserved hypothetical protein [Clostridium acetobutylicum EA 2018]AEI31618.1 hypothetical protein SMB_G1123 [Clostridium acetobutylicum DSM 1731]AWV81667.1 hypothetical protein DK921_16530 [Clostridium acetobutylicum]